MEVFVLLGNLDIETTVLLGVYHTHSDAIFHRSLHETKDDSYDGYTISRRVIGARPDPDFDGNLEAK